MIDNKEYTNEKYQFFMDSNLDIMVPVSILRDALNCSAHIYNEDTLLVEKHNSELSFSLNDDMIEVNGKKEKVGECNDHSDKVRSAGQSEGFCYPQSGNVWNLLVFCSVECDGIRSFTGAGLSVFGGSYDIE